MFSKKYGVEEFGRTGRQRAVMQATFQKMLQQNPLDLVDIAIDALGDVSTDMDATYIKKLILSVAKWEQQRLISFVYRLRIHTKQLLLEAILHVDMFSL